MRPVRRRPPAREPVRNAMRLFEQGEFGEAADAFDDLAQEAEEKGRLVQAAHLTARAARCYLQLDDVDAGPMKGA